MSIFSAHHTSRVWSCRPFVWALRLSIRAYASTPHHLPLSSRYMSLFDMVTAPPLLKLKLKSDQTVSTLPKIKVKLNRTLSQNKLRCEDRFVLFYNFTSDPTSKVQFMSWNSTKWVLYISRTPAFPPAGNFCARQTHTSKTTKTIKSIGGFFSTNISILGHRLTLKFVFMD